MFGFPITPAFEQEVEGKVRLVQIFERNRFELHPENARPYDVLLGRLSDELLQWRGTPWQEEPTAPTTQQAGCRYFAQTEHLVCDAFLRYWQSHGLEFDGKRGFSEAESLALFGLPLTEARVETNSSGDTVLTQWFERARFELHTNLGPDVVLLGLLGREAFEPPIDQPIDPRCADMPEPVDGYVQPNCLAVSELSGWFVLLVAYGFRYGEPVAITLTLTDTGENIGLEFSGGELRANNEDEAFPGFFGMHHYPAGLTPGLYAFTIEGLQSGHKAVLFFKVIEDGR